MNRVVQKEIHSCSALSPVLMVHTVPVDPLVGKSLYVKVRSALGSPVGCGAGFSWVYRLAQSSSVKERGITSWRFTVAVVVHAFFTINLQPDFVTNMEWWERSGRVFTVVVLFIALLRFFCNHLS